VRQQDQVLRLGIDPAQPWPRGGLAGIAPGGCGGDRGIAGEGILQLLQPAG
jgi:hypothetical protein